jgi:hypothetical protein
VVLRGSLLFPLLSGVRVVLLGRSTEKTERCRSPSCVHGTPQTFAIDS